MNAEEIRSELEALENEYADLLIGEAPASDLDALWKAIRQFRTRLEAPDGGKNI
jgi:hypothetical protein